MGQSGALIEVQRVGKIYHMGDVEVATVSLLVDGIGIMNIMLVSD